MLDDDRKTLDRRFEHVAYLDPSLPNPHALESTIPVCICRGAKFGTPADLWPKVKHWRWPRASACNTSSPHGQQDRVYRRRPGTIDCPLHFSPNIRLPSDDKQHEPKKK
jgi:hypothetical protein